MRIAAAWAIALGAAGCADDGLAPPLGHLAVHLDTDAPLPGAVGPDASPPLFDTVRVDVYPAGEAEPCASCSRDFDVDEQLFEHGASFTVEPAGRHGGGRVRVRLYRSASLVENEIDADSTIDVIAGLPAPPAEGGKDITVFLPTDAVGRPIGTLDAPAAATPGAPKGSRVGTWPGAARRGCADPPGEAEVCVPGGAFWMGHPLAVSTDPDFAGNRQRLVVVAPFYLDRAEVDVAELRASGIGASSDDVIPHPATPTTKDDSNWCTFTEAAGAEDPMPVTCIRWPAARKYCQTVRGGDLPTLAQLEYAGGALASSLYVWGKDPPSCDDAVWGRAGVGFFSTLDGTCRTDDVGGPVARPSGGPEAWGLPPRLRDRLDLPTGSIFDLAGNVSEWALDRHQSQDEPCWHAPDTNVLVDPVCDAVGALGDERSIFGGTWSEPGGYLRAALRNHGKPDIHTSVLGFRCARAAVPSVR